MDGGRYLNRLKVLDETVLTAEGRLDGGPRGVVDGHIQQLEECGQGGLETFVQREELSRHLLSVLSQDRQNFLPCVTGVPQLGQTDSSRAPQSSQKRAPPSFSAWHRGHFMREPPCSLSSEGRNGGPRVTAWVSRGQGHRRELRRVRKSSPLPGS